MFSIEMINRTGRGLPVSAARREKMETSFPDSVRLENETNSPYDEIWSRETRDQVKGLTFSC